MLGDEEARARAVLSEMQLRIAEGPHSALGVSESDPPEQVRAAFLALTKQFHPARFGRMSNELQRLSNEVFLGIKTAHDQLLKSLGSSRAALRRSSNAAHAFPVDGDTIRGTAPGPRGTQSMPRQSASEGTTPPPTQLARGTDRGTQQRPSQPMISPQRTTPASGIPVQQHPRTTTDPVRPSTPLGAGATARPTGSIPLQRPGTPPATGSIPLQQRPGTPPATGQVPVQRAASPAATTQTPTRPSTGQIPVVQRPGTPQPSTGALPRSSSASTSPQNRTATPSPHHAPARPGTGPVPTQTPGQRQTGSIPIQQRPQTPGAGTTPLHPPTPGTGTAPPQRPTPGLVPPRPAADAFNPGTVRGVAPAAASGGFDEATAYHDANSYLEQKNWTAARLAFHALAAKVPQQKQYRALLSYARGREAHAAGRMEDALLEYQRALQLDPELAVVKHAVAELQRRR